MKFSEFQELRASLLAQEPTLKDAAETNLYRALAHVAPPATSPLAHGDKVHRCHLATSWCERFGLAPAWDRRALVTRGVRDSLARLFRLAAGRAATVWLPEDNYPVYFELAHGAGAHVKSFPTLPVPRWPDAAPTGVDELLVVTQPMKPLGRSLQTAEVVALERWLAAHPRRRLVLDCVYTFSTRFEDTTMRLVAGGQTLLLHSLTKGWLAPRVFGVALVPEQDVQAMRALFQEDPPEQQNLAHARACLMNHAETPRAVAVALARAQERMRAALPGLTRGVPVPTDGYFTLIEEDWRVLRERDGVLALPARVFGSTRDDVSVLSSLAFSGG